VWLRTKANNCENCDFRNQHCLLGNDSGHAVVPVRKVRDYFEAARSADSHPFDTIEQSGDERSAVDADISQQSFAIVFKCCAAC
jgi:hypothetical protein